MRLFLVPGAVLLLSCSGSRLERDVVPERVLVQNDNWLDMVVFSVSTGGSSHRMGDVRSMGESLLDLPIGIPDGSFIQLFVDPIGSEESYITEQIIVSADQMIVLRISSHLAHSSWTISDAVSEGR